MAANVDMQVASGQGAQASGQVGEVAEGQVARLREALRPKNEQESRCSAQVPDASCACGPGSGPVPDASGACNPGSAQVSPASGPVCGSIGRLAAPMMSPFAYEQETQWYIHQRANNEIVRDFTPVDSRPDLRYISSMKKPH